MNHSNSALEAALASLSLDTGPLAAAAAAAAAPLPPTSSSSSSAMRTDSVPRSRASSLSIPSRQPSPDPPPPALSDQTIATPPKHIFLSYCTRDINFARYLHALLVQEGFTIWMDKTCLDTGMDWSHEIEKSLNACMALVVIMSPQSQQSNMVKSEVLHAIDRKKPIFPVLLAGEEPFLFLKPYHFEDMRGGLSASLSPSFVGRLKTAVGLASHLESSTRSLTRDCKRVRFNIVQGDVLSMNCDVLVLKYAASFFGADAVVARELREKNVVIDEMVLQSGSHELRDTNQAIAAKNALFVPTEGLTSFDYKSIRAFTVKFFEILAQENVPRKHVAMTIHGVGFGLDEDAALMAQLGGIMDCLNGADNANVCGIDRITIVEMRQDRVERLRQTVSDYFGSIDDAIACPSPNQEWGFDLAACNEQIAPNIPKAINQAPTAKPQRPCALIISSDDISHEDVFYYGIRHPIHAMGLLCERIEIKCITSQSETTKYQLERMEDAKIVVCDVSFVSPLLYYYLGYAMGKGIPTVIISKQTNLDFDGKHFDVIRYTKIWELEEQLRKWLKNALKR